jgi:putative addiction module component (TIGR02574 family)
MPPMEIPLMPSDVIDLFKQASDLPDRDRATLAGILLESLETEVDPDVEAAWKEEIERRLADLDAGRVQSIPWEEVKARLIRRFGGDASH